MTDATCFKRLTVRFSVRGADLVGHLYQPSGNAATGQFPAVVVGGSLSSVKEQMSGTYAAEMARRGIVALAIDYRHYGESGGEPRQYEDPLTKAEDLVAAAAYLASRPDVRAAGVGLLGICTSGGNVLYAAAQEPRIGAVVAVAGHFAEPAVIASVPVYGGEAAIARHRLEGRAARAAYEATGETAMIPCYHDTDRSAAHIGEMAYYLDPRRGGGVPQWRNAFAVMSWEPWLDFDPVREASRVKAPTLIIHADGCVMPDQARKVFACLSGPKALYWTTGEHFAFYDGPATVREAADMAAAHFHRCLDSEG